MPAATLSQLRNKLIGFVGVDNSGSGTLSFEDSLSEVLERIYGEGRWRDTTFEVELPISNNCITLPNEAESLLFGIVDRRPAYNNALWHDYIQIGTPDNPPQVYGLIDDGWHVGSVDLDSGLYDLFFTETGLPAFNSATRIYIDGENESGIRNPQTITEDSVAVIITGDAETTDNGVSPNGLLSATTPFPGAPSYSNNGVDPLTAPASAFPIWSLFQALGSTWFLNYYSASGVLDAQWRADAGDDPDDPAQATNWVTLTNATGTPVLESGYSATESISSLDSVSWDAVGGRLNVELVQDSDAVQFAEMLDTEGVLRTRRYRVAGSRQVNGPASTTVFCLLKRRVPKLDSSDTVVHIGNIPALKHGLLAKINEDNASPQEAEYHWGRCFEILDKELSNSFGGQQHFMALYPGQTPIPTSY